MWTKTFFSILRLQKHKIAYYLLLDAFAWYMQNLDATKRRQKIMANSRKNANKCIFFVFRCNNREHFECDDGANKILLRRMGKRLNGNFELLLQLRFFHLFPFFPWEPVAFGDLMPEFVMFQMRPLKVCAMKFLLALLCTLYKSVRDHGNIKLATNQLFYHKEFIEFEEKRNGKMQPSSKAPNIYM